MIPQHAYMSLGDNNEPETETTPNIGQTRQQTRALNILTTLRTTLTPLAQRVTESELFSAQAATNEQEDESAVEESKQSETLTLTDPTSQEGREEQNDTDKDSSESETDSNIDNENPNDPKKLDQENASYILEQQVRKNVNEMNDDLDKADAEDDTAFLVDILNKVQSLLQDAVNKSKQSPRKLQNWIEQIKAIYKPQFAQLPNSEQLTNAIQQFDTLLEDADIIYDNWLEKETEERVKRETKVIEKL